MKFKKYLVESKQVSNTDKKKLLGFIKSPPKGRKTIKVKNFGDVDMNASKGGVIFSYDTNFFEITTELVDMVDLMDEYQFKTTTKGDVTLFTVTEV